MSNMNIHFIRAGRLERCLVWVAGCPLSHNIWFLYAKSAKQHLRQYRTGQDNHLIFTAWFLGSMNGTDQVSSAPVVDSFEGPLYIYNS